MHKELASNYRSVILSRAQEAIKNSAAKQVTYTDFFKERGKVESLFASAIQERWEAQPSLHCYLDQFHLGRIRIPESVVAKQLESRIQNERNDRESFLQKALLERESTKVEVNQISLNTTKTLRTAEADASLIRAKAVAEAQLIISQAEINGTKSLLEAAGIESQHHKISLTYIRALRERQELNIAVSYLSEDGVVRTAPL